LALRTKLENQGKLPSPKAKGEFMFRINVRVCAFFLVASWVLPLAAI
jgi:hypothetical protein